MSSATILNDTILLFDSSHTYLTVDFGCRMTIIKLNNSDLILHSPIPITDAMHQDIVNFGTVKHIISPSLFHHSYLLDCIKRYPEANVYGVKGLNKKYPELNYQRLDNHDYDFAWKDELNHFCLMGMPTVNECVFYHYSTKTLILTDLLFNITNKTGWSKLFFKFYGIYNKLCTTFLFKSLILTKPLFKQDIDYLKTLPKTTIVLAHGSIITKDADLKFNDALSWV